VLVEEIKVPMTKTTPETMFRAATRNRLRHSSENDEHAAVQKPGGGEWVVWRWGRRALKTVWRDRQRYLTEEQGQTAMRRKRRNRNRRYHVGVNVSVCVKGYRLRRLPSR
jgi:hypothetical protein